MTTAYNLSLKFATDIGETLSMSISRANPALTDQEVMDAAKILIDCGAVRSMSKGAPTKLNEATLKTTDKTEYEVTNI